MTPCPECGGLLTLANGKTEAHCGQCGALVANAQEGADGAPEVVGHRAPAPARPRRAAGETAARKTTARKTTARKTTTRKAASTVRKTSTARKTAASSRATTTRAS
ncbi:MAG TPA: hypothetical protein VFW76_04745, partial [Ktedonobacterales bacterium]|nr:hypothetical protein [Ktedonobacterales bacterium]